MKAGPKRGEGWKGGPLGTWANPKGGGFGKTPGGVWDRPGHQRENAQNKAKTGKKVQKSDLGGMAVGGNV